MKKLRRHFLGHFSKERVSRTRFELTGDGGGGGLVLHVGLHQRLLGGHVGLRLEIHLKVVKTK